MNAYCFFNSKPRMLNTPQSEPEISMWLTVQAFIVHDSYDWDVLDSEERCH